MIAAFLLVVFWLVPLQMVMAVMAERIAVSKGMRVGNAFFKTAFLGYGELVEVSRAPSHTPQYLFHRHFSARLLELVLIFSGSAALPLTMLMFSYAIPGDLGDYVTNWSLTLVAVWCALWSIGLPLAAIWLRNELKRLPAEERPSSAEFAILRNLLIPSVIPLTAFALLGLIGIGCLVVVGLVQVLLTGLMNGPTILVAACAVIGIPAALAVSPLSCYELAQRKQRSAALWVPVGFVMPILAPLALSLMKTHDTEKAAPSDWQTAMIMHGQFFLILAFLSFGLSAINKEMPMFLRPWVFATVPTWLIFSLVMPFFGTRALKLAPTGLSASRLAIRAAGIESFCLAIALTMYFIQKIMHSELL